ncbi:MAG TPA: helix-turn-helix domain-containing protein [Solirubrobacterales bacterium]|nr:helix-turn-helix domain-containing protein [Solirubrobacterales bacterium]
MAEYDERGTMQIGEVLKGARTRQGLDIRTVEERTKIRTKYLRALENEEWDVLPSAAYAKGFLRTYGRLLGLDADALVDEFRRQVEVPSRPSYPVGGEPVLERRRRLDERRGGPRWGAILGVAAAAVVVFLLVLGLTGGDDDGGGDRADRRGTRQERQERRRERRQQRRQAVRREAEQAAAGPVRLRLVLRDDVRVCLIGDGGRPLIDGQVLPGGSEELFEADRFRLGFPSGFAPDQLGLFVDGERRSLPEVDGPASFRIRPLGRIRRAPDPGPGCP